MANSNVYITAEERLSKLMNLRSGDEHDRGNDWYTVGPRWMHRSEDAFALMAAHTTGYYEGRERTSKHCFVIGNLFGEATVVYLRDHDNKELALRYAIVLAVTAKYEHLLRTKVRLVSGRAWREFGAAEPSAAPETRWLSLLARPCAPRTAYFGVYEFGAWRELQRLAKRELTPADVPALEWTARLSECLLRADGAILYSATDETEVGEMDGLGGVAWIKI